MAKLTTQLKVACVTCYFDPDYVRARTLRAAIESFENVDLIVCKNRHKGMLRYAEMLIKLVTLRLQEKPDAYVLTFRGQEMLPLLLLIAGKKPVIFDEFLVPLAWANQESHQATPTVKLQRALARALAWPYKQWLNKCYKILADTVPHAELSAQLSGVPAQRYLPVPVGADEDMFRPAPQDTAAGTGKPFRVFFCGNMRPLYGLKYVLAAAEALKGKDILFDIAGGDAGAAADVAQAQKNGANIQYTRWLPFDEFPGAMHAADLCLTQYGNTPQATRVISGKAYQMLACARPVLLGASLASTMFTDKQNCLLIPQADSGAITEAILWAQEHPKELAVIAQNGRLLYQEQFSIIAIAKTLEPVITSIAARP